MQSNWAFEGAEVIAKRQFVRHNPARYVWMSIPAPPAFNRDHFLNRNGFDAKEAQHSLTKFRFKSSELVKNAPAERQGLLG